ncbi:zinc-binding dehydrogenase [Variovorax sp. J22P271]|uniref:zinc-binding dehydrogenase n=1 Tax=Variovorax davisae TaxID=3053515 RepID=UPI002575F5AA|nr:zinc-binding dehydrogenase [Variovorax sp. J22P271]MDM0034393.1 zinc-binding dehydrogenase [Variovorax sp. J22P271]
MQAVFITGHGGNEVVVVGERPRPVRGPGEVLVRLQAATLNQVDLYMRDSGAGITHRLPQIMGLDGAGIVEEVDADERLLAPGQQVVLHPGIACGRCEFCQRGEGVLCTAIQYLGEHRDGTLAEYVSVPARNVFAMPAHLRPAEAAALGVNHLTAWRMLFTKAQLKPWETVLIFGIGGGVSLAALQLARLAGARVIVTSRSEAKLQRALQMGADHAIDSPTRDVAKEVMALTGGRGVDVVIENVGAAVWSSAMKSLVRGGRLVTCGATSGDQPPADLRRIFIRQLQILGSTLGDLDEFAALLSLVRRTGLRPVIDAAFPMADAHAALDRLAAADRFGKVAIAIGDGAR